MNFNIDFLTQLNYERSKKWATFLEMVSGGKDNEIINFRDGTCEEVLGNDETDDSNELGSMEDNDEIIDNAIAPDVLEDITNCSRTVTGRRKLEMTLSNDSNEAKHELVDLLNHTMPIINEHNRQMKESGLESVLNTFDKQEIEEKVGDWLKSNPQLRHNGKEYSRPSCIERKTMTDVTESDSDTSFHSGDLARYVRSSRLNSNKNTPTSTRKIKTFCTVRGKREELRQKYGCQPNHDETYLKAVRHRRKCNNFEEFRHNDFHSNIHSNTAQRRKVLRKRIFTCKSSSTQSDDSESDEHTPYQRFDKRHKILMDKKCCCRYQICDCKYCKTTHSCADNRCRIKKKESNGAKCLHKTYCGQQCLAAHLHSSSSSSNNSHTQKCRPKMNKRFYTDPRPCKRESECQCYTGDKLCPNYKHLAETSNKEWFVENYYSLTKTTIDSPVNGDEKIRSDDRVSMKTLPKESSKSEDEYEKQIQLAIEESLKLFEEEQSRHSVSSLKKSCSKTKQSASKGTKVRKRQAITNTPSDDDEVALKLSKVCPRDKENSLNRKGNLSNNKIGRQMDFSVNAFNNNASSNIYNSTLLSYKRQIVTPLNRVELASENMNGRQQATPMVSSTSVCNMKRKDCQRSLRFERRSDIITEDANDCTVVSSTTSTSQHNSALHCSQQIKETGSVTRSKQEPQANQTMSGKERGILIYAPDDESSLAPNGFFEVTQEHLSTIIGEKAAKNFFKFYVGRRRFSNKSTIYFRPPSSTHLLDRINEIESESESDNDILDYFGKFGDLYESLNS